MFNSDEYAGVFETKRTKCRYYGRRKCFAESNDHRDKKLTLSSKRTCSVMRAVCTFPFRSPDTDDCGNKYY